MRVCRHFVLFLCAFSLAVSPDNVSAADWPAWRGLSADGVSPEKGLPSSWTPGGENMLWKAAIGGRSTPIVFDGRVCINTLAEPGDPTKWQEWIACYDADTGKQRWEYRYNIFQTDIPHHRVGWANLVGDESTGYVYSHGVEGMVHCFDRDGKIVWSRSLGEEVGRISGFGGRTVNPVLDGGLVIVSFLSAGWGSTFIPRHRLLRARQNDRRDDLDLNSRAGAEGHDLFGPDCPRNQRPASSPHRQWRRRNLRPQSRDR